MKGNEKEACEAIVFALLIRCIFTYYQAVEYYEASFTIRDRVYGSVFFLTTGFHGLHVIGGTIFLVVQLLRIY